MRKLSLSMVFILVMAAYCYAEIVTIGVGDWVDIRGDINDNFTEVSSSTWGESDPFMIVAPDNIYAVVGVESNVFFDNLVKEYAGISLINWDVSDSDDEATGVHEIVRWTDTPSDITDDGNVLTFSVHDTSGSSRDTHDLTYHVAPASTHGDITCLFIGDSMGAGTATAIDDLDTADSNIGITWVGTQGSDPLHEAYGGKTVSWFYTHADSPLTKTGAFDYPAYLTDNSLDTPDLIIIQLGGNDVFALTDEISVAAIAATNITQIEAMITAFRVENTAVQVFLGLISPPSDQDDMGGDYDIGQTAWRYKRYAQLYNTALMANSWPFGVSVIGQSLNLDTANEMTNGLHPDSTGYDSVGDAYYAAIKNKLPTQISYHDSIYNSASRPTTSDDFVIVDGILTTIASGNKFDGAAVTFKASKKTTYNIKVDISWGADSSHSIVAGILLWSGTSAVTYDLPSGSEGAFDTFLGNINYVKDEDDVDLAIDTTIDLSAAPTFDHISVHISGYADGNIGPGDYAFAICDLSTISVEAQ